MRRLLLAILLTSVAVAACDSPAPSKPALTTKPAAPSPTPTPTPSLPLRAQPVQNKWPKLYNWSNHASGKRFLDRDGYDLSAEYPQLSSSKPEVRRFNRWIKRKILGYAGQFRRLADAEQRRKKKHPPSLWGLDLSYIVYYANEQLISLRLTHDVMQARQMHPIAYYETINYDLKRGRELRANDVFKRGYLKVFSRHSRKVLKETYQADYFEAESGTRPLVDNFENWNIVPGGVLLSFEDYQVGPHSFGQPEFVVPFSELRNRVRRDILRRLLPASKQL